MHLPHTKERDSQKKRKREREIKMRIKYQQQNHVLKSNKHFYTSTRLLTKVAQKYLKKKNK